MKFRGVVCASALGAQATPLFFWLSGLPRIGGELAFVAYMFTVAILAQGTTSICIIAIPLFVSVAMVGVVAFDKAGVPR